MKYEIRNEKYEINIKTNSNIECRNPKQIRMTKIPMLQTKRASSYVLNFENSYFDIVSYFGFRASNL